MSYHNDDRRPLIALPFILGGLVYTIHLARKTIQIRNSHYKKRLDIVPPIGLDPVGAQHSAFKTIISRFMARIAQWKESRKFASSSPASLEAYHAPFDHEFGNESHYFNGADETTRDRFVTRISRRGKNAKQSYVFLLLDLYHEGELSLEADVEASTTTNPSALGLQYECIIPMKQWRLKYSGMMRRGCFHPRNSEALAKAEQVHVEMDLVYDVDTPLFWYMRDDHPECLAGNLAQEPWGLNFLKVCLKRTVDHAHYEDFGRVRGSIKVGNNHTKTNYNFGTFRDHSWDIRRWATMDRLSILLIAFDKPLVIGGHEYWYLDLTLVDMPGNIGGVARYSTGYLFGKIGMGSPTLTMVAGTSILDMGYSIGPPGFPGGAPERFPLPTQDCIMFVEPHPRDLQGWSHQHHSVIPTFLSHCKKHLVPTCVRISMKGPIRRVIYWPDNGAFKVYEDAQDFSIACNEQLVKGYGTRQTGFRVGEFDPSLGGCG
jgi:hypothetical protein